MTEECKTCDKRFLAVTDGYQCRKPFYKYWSNNSKTHAHYEKCYGYKPDKHEVERLHRWAAHYKLKATAKRQRRKDNRVKKTII